MTKIIFFDIDGTLLELGAKEMHPQLIDTLNKLYNKGIKLFLATGRPPFVIPTFENVHFDGVLAFNGAYCYTKNGCIYKNPLNQKDINIFIDNAKKMDHAVNLASIDKMGCNFYDKTLKEYFTIANQDIHILEDYNDFKKNEIYQMMVASTPSEEKKLLENTSTLQVARWWDKAVDIIPKNGGKDKGIEAILNYFNIKKDEAMAFGDGGNDISMLKFVGKGIAMGNATDDVKKAADYTTDTAQNDGIISALKHFEII